jgi:GxxExxY protein
LLIVLRDKGLAAQAQVPLAVCFRGAVVGDFYADIVVENQVIVELKTVKQLAPEHLAQTINYLNATGIEVGLLLNFGNARLEYRRLHKRDGPEQARESKQG